MITITQIKFISVNASESSFLTTESHKHVPFKNVFLFNASEALRVAALISCIILTLQEKGSAILFPQDKSLCCKQKYILYCHYYHTVCSFSQNVLYCHAALRVMTLQATKQGICTSNISILFT